MLKYFLQLFTCFMLLYGCQPIKTKPNESQVLRGGITQHLQKKLPTTIDTSMAALLHHNNLVYTIEPVFLDDHCTFVITLAFTLSGNDSLSLITPRYEQKHQQFITNIERFVRPDSALNLNNDYQNPIAVFGKKGTTAIIRYVIVQDSLARNEMQPFPAFLLALHTNHFVAARNGILLVPTQLGALWNSTNNKHGSVTIIWKNIPRTWSLASTFAGSDSVQHFEGDITNFMETMFCGGEILVERFENAGRNFIVSVVAEHWYLSSFLGNLTKKIVQTEQNFFRDYSLNPHTHHVIIAPLAPPYDNLVGTGYPSTFATFPKRFEEGKQMDTLEMKIHLAHEIFHWWNTLHKTDETSETAFHLYFSEGFTDYFARLILLENHSITRQEYIWKYNEVLECYYGSPNKNIVSSVITAHVDSAEIRLLAYWKGDILAHQWDAEIQKYTNGKSTFADVFRLLLRNYERIDEHIFAREMKPFLGRDIMPDITRYMKNGETIPTQANLFPFARLERILSPHYPSAIPQFTTITTK
jgi:predicted metalloprotease with PDZ domain